MPSSAWAASEIETRSAASGATREEASSLINSPKLPCYPSALEPQPEGCATKLACSTCGTAFRLWRLRAFSVVSKGRVSSSLLRPGGGDGQADRRAGIAGGHWRHRRARVRALRVFRRTARQCRRRWRREPREQ